jgi:hypothetical protein
MEQKLFDLGISEEKLTVVGSNREVNRTIAIAKDGLSRRPGHDTKVKSNSWAIF